MPAKVLIVEDDILTALGMADVVIWAGYDVIGSVRSVSGAVAKASTISPDVVVFDIRLAGQRDGIEGARILKQMCGTQVVFVSGEADGATLERAKALEPVAFLCKPCPPNDLLSAVQKAVGPRTNPRSCGWI